MSKWIQVVICLALATLANGQEKTVVIKVNGNYGLINSGLDHGIREGRRFRTQTPNRRNQYGEVEVIKTSRKAAAVKLLVGNQGYTLKVGDVLQISDDFVADELLRGFDDDYSDGNFDIAETENQQINRRGFIIGFGIGIGNLSSSANGAEYYSRRTFLSDFKIGYAPTNSSEIYYINKVSWWGTDNITFTGSLSSLGFTIYTDSRTATGPFFSFGGGLASVDAPFESNIYASYGFGFFGGLGYEFSPHISIQADLIYGRITDVGIVVDSFVARFTINALAY